MFPTIPYVFLPSLTARCFYIKILAYCRLFAPFLSCFSQSYAKLTNPCEKTPITDDPRVLGACSHVTFCWCPQADWRSRNRSIIRGALRWTLWTAQHSLRETQQKAKSSRTMLTSLHTHRLNKKCKVDIHLYMCMEYLCKNSCERGYIQWA